MKKKDFSKYRYRASQISKLATGTIGLTDIQEKEMRELNVEKETGINVNGNKCKWTDTKESKLLKLSKEFNCPTLPKTMQSEVRAIYRAEKYNRNFNFSTKFTQKGTIQEDEAITVYQQYRNAKGIRTFFIKNEEWLFNDFFSGTPDLRPMEIEIDGEIKKVGFDVKCSWELKTFPFPEDDLIEAYKCQNEIYMELEDADIWITAAILVNCPESLLNNEKLKHFYSLGAPNEDHKNYAQYIKLCRDTEKQLVFDYDRFVDVYPYHQLEWSREEWMTAEGVGNDIPLMDRVLEKVIYRDKNKIKHLESRVEIARKYMVELQKQDENKLILI